MIKTETNMTASPTSPFTLGTKVARVEYHGGIPRVTTAYVVHTTKTGRFRVRYPHMKEGEMSSAVYVPKLKWQNKYVDGLVVGGQNEWRTDKLGVPSWDREGDWRLWDADVEAIVAKRKDYDRTARLLDQVQEKVREMRATWEGVGPKVEELARVLGIDLSEEEK